MLPLMFAAGAALLVAGIALVFVPAALICAGVVLMLSAYGVARAQDAAAKPGPKA